MKPYLIGFDVGGTKCAVSLGKESGNDIEIISKESFATPPTWQDALGRMFLSARELLGKANIPIDDVRASGFSCGGPLDNKKGIIQLPPNLPGWDDVPATALAEQALGIPSYLENDANACAIAEWKWGAGAGFDNVIFLTFGTGLGAGLILDGRLYAGANGNAGEVGHVRQMEFGPVGFGKPGAFEGFCSGGGLEQVARTIAIARIQSGLPVSFLKDGDLENIDVKTIFDCARAMQPDAREVTELCARQLGLGLSMLIDILNPECIVIGSIFTRCEDILRPTMEEVMRRETLPVSLPACVVRPATLGESIGDYAALSVAAYRSGE